MEIKKGNEFRSNHFDKQNIYEISLKQLIRLKCAQNFGENLRIKRFHSNEKNKHIVRHSGENKIFQNPRRRKIDQKRMHQGHNKVWNLAKMPRVSDSLRFKDTFLVQDQEIMLQSAVVATMWNKCYDRETY